MTTRIYNIDNDWCFLNIYLKQHNTYWIDWEEYMNLLMIKNKNILCVKDEEYCYYDTNNSTYYSLHDKKLSLCVDDIKCLTDLNLLNNIYENKLVVLNK